MKNGTDFMNKLEWIKHDRLSYAVSGRTGLYYVISTFPGYHEVSALTPRTNPQPWERLPELGDAKRWAWHFDKKQPTRDT
jgi:hypothetical protein